METCADCKNFSFSIKAGKCLHCGGIEFEKIKSEMGTDETGDYFINPYTGEKVYE